MSPVKPGFLIIGAAKAATTTLSSMLDQHPQAGIIEGKEPHFFSMDPVYARGWSWYQSGFQRCEGKSLLGDASTSYSRIRYHPHTVARILHHVPEIKIIYMVRHPLERIESAYVERLAFVDAKHAYPSINQAVKAEPMMIDSSRYWEVFDHYRSHFGEDRVKIVWFEDFTRDCDAGFKDVCRFLEIRDNIAPAPGTIQKNTRSQVLESAKRVYPGSASAPDTSWEPRIRQWVVDQLRTDNARLLEHFGKPPDYWDGLLLET